MQNWRSVTVGLFFAGIVGTAAAQYIVQTASQFDGPAPLAWRFQQATKVAPGGSPVVSGNSVFVSVGSYVYALNKSNGNQKWRFPAADPIDGYFRTAPVLVGDTLVATADNKTVYGINLADGSTKWSYVMTSGVLSQPVKSGMYIVIPTADNTLVALDGDTGKPLKGYPYAITDGIQGSLAAYQDDVFFFTGGDELRCLNITTEKTSWHKRFTAVPANAEPTVFGDDVYSISGQYLVCIGAATGVMKFQTSIGDESAFGPAVSANGIMTVTPDGNANFFDLGGHKMSKSSANLGSLPAVKPASVGNLFVVATTNGAVNLVDPNTGNLLWSYLVRPVGGIIPATANNNQNGGQQSGTNGTGLGQKGSTASTGGVYTIRASGAPVLDGSTLLVLAQDGSLLAFDRRLGVDMTPPDVQMVWPAAGSLISGRPPLEFVFTLDDEASGVNEKSISVDIDGAPLDFKFGRDGFLVVDISEFGKNPPLNDGHRVITVTASDWMGNEAKVKYSLTVDNTLKPLGRPNQDQTNGGKGGPTGAGTGGGGKGGGGGSGGR